MKKSIKNLTCVLIVLCMILSFAPVNVKAEQEEHSLDHDLCLMEKVQHLTRVPAGYVGIYTVEDLKALQGSKKTTNYILMNSLDLSGEQWSPLKFENGSGFAGIFDGNGYTIRNFNADTDDHIGLFYRNDGTIKNLRITGKINISSDLLGNRMAASLVLENVGTIENCTSAVDFFNADGLVIIIGGIAVYNGGTIRYCRFTGSMRTTEKGFANFGGIAYENTYHYYDYYNLYDRHGRIEYCESNASLSAYLGNEEGFPVYVNSVEVKIGGIVGIMDMSTYVSVCRFTGSIYVAGTIVDGEIMVGGIACKAEVGGESIFENCSFTGKIRFNCTCQRTPYFYVGGICGSGGNNTLKQCFVSGEILDEGTILGAPGWFYGEDHTINMESNSTSCYYPSGSLDLCGSGGNRGFDTGFSAVPLASMAQQATFKGFDFANIWTMGQSYPIQKVFLNHYADGQEPVPGPEPADDEMDDEEFILQHLAFIQSGEYETRSALRFSALMEDCMDSPDQESAERAYKILNTINETTKFKTWSIFDNQYEAVIAELITRSAMEETDSIDLKMKSQSLTISKNLWEMLKNAYPGKFEEKTYETSLQKLLKDPVGLEEENPRIFRELKGAMDSYFVNGQDKADMIRAISGTTAFYGKINHFVDYMNDCASVVEWVCDLHNFQCTVEALYSLSQEQIGVFRLLDDYIKESAGNVEYMLYRAAYERFDNYLTKEVIGAAVFEEGVRGFGKLTFDVLSPFISTVMTGYFIKALGLTPAEAGSVAILIAGYQAGWAIGTALTNNDKIMADCDLLHVNAAIEEALYQVTIERAAALDSQKTLTAAREFDAVWMLLRNSEMYAVSIYKDMLQSMQDSMKSKFLTLGRVDIYGNSKADEITLANYEYIKWDAAICHGQKMHERIAGDQRQINSISLSGTRNFSMSSLSGALLLEVIDGEICLNSPSVAVVREDDGYTVHLGGDIELVLEIFEDDDTSGMLEIVTVDENGVEICRNTTDVDMTDWICLEISQHDDQIPAVEEYHYYDDEPGSIEIDPAECILEAGDTFMLEAILDDRLAGEKITWWSDDPEIVSVDQYGNIRALQAGSTLINAAAGQDDDCASAFVLSLFRDVTNENAYYFDPVYWALDRGITKGTSKTTFSPNGRCLRYQFVLFLWRLAGQPAPTSGSCPFIDVKRGDSFYEAVRWAYENHITTGTDAAHFSPNAELSRGQVCTFLYRYAGSPEVNGPIPFVDVGAERYYADAVRWAVQEGITNGTDQTHFSPGSVCTRAQTVTFIYRLE